jgi:hypothetical protein
MAVPLCFELVSMHFAEIHADSPVSAGIFGMVERGCYIKGYAAYLL